MSRFRDLISRAWNGIDVEKERKREQSFQTGMQPIRQQAVRRLNTQRQAGTIDTSQLPGRGVYGRDVAQRKAYESKMQSILGTAPDTSVRRLPNGLIVNSQKNSGFQTALTGLGSGIMQAAPQRIAGGLAEYGGTVLGNDSMRDFGSRLSQPFRDYGAVQGEQASNKALYMGSNVAGGLLTLPIAPAAKAGMAYRGVKYAAPTAGDTAYAVREGGGSRLAQSVGGGLTGGVTGFLGTVGAEKILRNPLAGQTLAKGTGKLAGSLSPKVAPNIAKRLFQAGNMEGLEEVVESGVENLVAKNTYNPELSLKDAASEALQSYAMGFGGGAVARGGVELGQNPRVQNTAKNVNVKTRQKAKPMGAVSEDVQNDSVYKSLEKKIDTTVERMSKATGRLKENYRVEALEYIRQRNARAGELSQGGYLQLGGKQEGTPDAYRQEIKDRIQKESDYFFENKKTIQQSDTSRNMYSAKGNTNAMSTTNEKMFKEFAKDPDAFIDKYKLMPPTESGALPKSKPKTTKASDTNPLESLKQEARKYGSAEEFRKNLLYNDDIILHQTGKNTADKINKEGFKSGKETGLGEKRSEVYGMTAYDWMNHKKFSKDTYARDGSDVAEVAIDTKGLKIADRTKQKFTDEEYVKGIHKQIPEGYDGVKVGYGNGVNEVLLKPEVANARRFNIDDLYTQSQPPKSTPKTDSYLDTNTSQQVLNKTIQPKSELWSRWFKKSDYTALPEIEQDILKNPQIKDAGTSRMYDYYKEMFGENMTYDDFLNKDITLYRGGNTRANNNMASYSLLERKAKRFGDVSSVTVKPKDTYGMLGDFSEGEVFVPAKSQSTPTVGKKPTIQDALEGSKKPFVSFTEIAEGRATVDSRSRQSTDSTVQQEQVGIQSRPQQKNQSKIQVQPQGQGKLQTSRGTDRQALKVETSSSSKPTKLEVNNTTKAVENTINEKMSEKEWGSLMMQVDTEAPGFNAVAGAKGTNNSNKLVAEIQRDNAITESARKASQNGSELHFYAQKDKNGRSVGIVPFNPQNHRIEAGFVLDSDNNVVGNHIKVDDTGIQVNVGGDLVNLESVVGNPLDWVGTYKARDTIGRNIKNLAPNKEIAEKTYRYVVTHKTKADAAFKQELGKTLSDNKTSEQNLLKSKPSKVKDADYLADSFDFAEGKLTKAQLQKKYGTKSANAIEKSMGELRNKYDTLLDRVNTEYAKFGEQQVPKRENYITHLVELSQKPSFAGEMFGQLQNSLLGEGQQTTRSKVPADIAGRTENFEPRKKWNKFFQPRLGSKDYQKNPFKAFDAYVTPALYNINMTESAVRARSIEQVFRTAQEIQKLDQKAVGKDLSESIAKYEGADDKVTKMFQEYANALAGKTEATDRAIIDKSKGLETGLRGWQQLQRIGGRATIVGNAQSVLSQTLGMPIAVADAGVSNSMKGLAASLRGDTTIDKSPFITERRQQIRSPFRSFGQKALDVGGVPLQKMELAFVEQTWHSQHAKAISEGRTGQDAILHADRNTERIVAGRGIADKPELYRSTLANGVLQYTLEVNAQDRVFWNDLNSKQKVKFMVGASVMNTVMGAITGFQPLPDFLKAAFESIKDFTDDDEESILQDTTQAGQRLLGEYADMNPIVSAGANILPQSTRKTVFGADSSVGRFEGTAAPVQVVKNAVTSVGNLAQGKYNQAVIDGLKTVPAGNQAQKTLRGGQMIARGYDVDKAGNPTFAAPDNLIDKGKALIFGPTSTSNARNYYDNDQKNITGKADLATLESSTNKAQTVSEIQQRRLDTKEGKVAASTQGNSREELVSRLDAGDTTLTDTEKKIAKTLKDLPQGLSEEATNEILRYERLNTNTKKRLYKGVDGKLAIEKAWYEKDMLQGTLTESQQYDTEFKIAKLEIAQPYGDRVYDLYGMALYKINTIADEDTYSKLVAYDRELFENDLISKPKFKENRNAKSRSGRGGSSGSRGGKSSSKNGKFNIPSGFSLLPGGSSGGSGSVADLVRNAEVIYRKS